MSVAFRTAESTPPGTLRDQLQRWLVTAGNDQPLNSGKNSFTFHVPTRSLRAYRIAPSSGHWPACSATRGTSKWRAVSTTGSSSPSASQTLQVSSTVADIDSDLTIADPYEELWGKTQQDFVDTYLRHNPEPLASLAWPFRHLLDHPDENPFLVWAAPGVLSAWSLRSTADKQTGFHASRYGWPRVVPWGLSAENHFLFSKQLSDHSYDMEIDPPPELDYAMRWSLSTSTVAAARFGIIRRLRVAAGRLRALDEAVQGCMSARIRRVAGSSTALVSSFTCASTPRCRT